MADETKPSGIAALRQAEEQIITQPPAEQPAPIEGELIILDKSLLETDAKDTPAPEAPSEAAPTVPVAEQSSQEYQPPVTEELQPQEPAQQAPAPTAPEAPAAASEEAAGYDVTPALVESGEMVAANGSATSGVMLSRIAKHMSHLTGKKGFGSNKERWEEQASFIECVGRSLGLPYDDYVMVTNELIQQIRDNLKLFTSGDAYRFMHDLTTKYPENKPVKYPKESADRYQAYMSFLTTIARNYTTRHRLRTSTDVGFATKDMNMVGKQNVTKFFTQLTAQ
jgi:3-oxoacyl-[acyl-carrier protein] reductase